MAEKFIAEPIRPAAGSFATAFMERGIPGLPNGFVWRKQQYVVQSVIRTWRSTGPCRHGSGERYMRRYWFKIKTASGA